MLKNKKQRPDAEIPGSSLADIAFLLLIFFLVTTTIDVDTGIGMVLPPPPEGEPPPIKERNLMKVLVDSQGRIQINSELVNVNDVKEKIKQFILNNGKDENLSERPSLAIVSIKTQRQTPYTIYINVLDEIKGSYKELRNEWSLQNYGRPFSQLGKEAIADVKDALPEKISIAEPDKN